MRPIKPNIYFWITSIIIFVIGFFDYNTDSIVINIHDTYYVISNLDFIILSGSFYVIIGFIYWILSKSSLNLNVFLTKIHTTTSIFCFLIFMIGIFYYSITENKFIMLDDSLSMDAFIVIIFIIFSFIQILFIINLCTSMLAHFYFNKKLK
ncbi:hypothetical protein EV196_102141 [Mariniflexile fucanivorans]|uniref:Uncharacterized protein n=1 Tax=Mariniflexile fucanivorans TaxID=264023 RepID=A0A4R1RMS2_9FLAO|nr:hypothetical protein EV196_102141 [Mariniflexile fucanivorans]